MENICKNKEKALTGYPSIDKPWLKYYSEEAIESVIPNSSAYEYLVECIGTHVKDVAIKYMKKRIQYGRLLRYIDMVAEAFEGIGIKQGDTVVLALPNIPENVYCIYALNKLGAITNMVDLRAKGDTLVNYLNENNAKVAVVCDLFAENVIEVVKKTNISKLIITSPYDSLTAPLRLVMKLKRTKVRKTQDMIMWDDFFKHKKGTKRDVAKNQDDIACIFHTSGTTGTPKGVIMTNRGFNAMVMQYKYCGVKVTPCDRFLNQVPPFLAYNTIISMHMPLCLHMTVVLLPDYQPDKFAKNIMKLKINHAFAGPADWGNFLENRSACTNLSFLQTLASGSDTMAIKVKQEVDELVQSCGSNGSVLEGYGMTQIGSAACANLPQCNVMGSVGIPLPKNTFCVVDVETGEELTYNKTGEVCMTGPTVMKGYLDQPTETAEVLKKHSDGLVWLHSGDLGHIDTNGCVYIDGRIKRIIIRHDGIKISPFNIERIILTHKSVKACCVVGIKDREHSQGKMAAVYVVPQNRDNDYELLAEIRRMCEQKLSRTYWPILYEFIEDLPFTQNGKVDYRRLEEMAAAHR